MIGDIVCEIILGLVLLFVAFICVALCISAGRYDRITEEQYEEYCRRSEGMKMSDRNRTPEEYIKRHADQYHNGDTERAKEDAIVKEVLPTLEVE